MYWCDRWGAGVGVGEMMASIRPLFVGHECRQIEWPLIFLSEKESFVLEG